MSVSTAIPIGMAELMAEAASRMPWSVALLAGKTAGVNGANLRTIENVAAGDEVAGRGYSRKSLSGARVEVREGRPCLQFDAVTWEGADIYTSGAVIFNTDSGHIGCVLSFGQTLAAANGAAFVLPFDCPIRF